MMNRTVTLAAIAASMFLGTHAVACLWDSDTLEVERQRFPDVLELITGKFARHSKEFYQWRVVDRQRRIESGDATPELYDDLAVAYDKLDQQTKAIETILAKEEFWPGLYETYANLGTFYIHSGQFEKGIEQIERAIEINPDAHFGREIYQKLLVEYVLAKRGQGEHPLPLNDRPDDFGPGFSRVGFAEFAWKRGYHFDSARQGVLGMMRFGHYDSPVLLEALGDLLLAIPDGSEGEDAKRLAARAYLKASYEVDNEDTRQAYRRMAQKALNMQTVSARSSRQLSLEQLEANFQKELTDAKQWYARVNDDEVAWIAADKNPEEEFSRTYYNAPKVEMPTATAGVSLWLAMLVMTLLLLIGLGLLIFWRWQKSHAKRLIRAGVSKP